VMEQTQAKPRDPRAIARVVGARFSLRRGVTEIAVDLVFALAILLVLFAAFMFWQAWLASRQVDAVQSLARGKADAVRQVAAVIATRRAEVVAALAQPRLRELLSANDDDTARTAAAEMMKAAIPDAREVTFYSPQLKEVLHGNLRKLGYSRAAQLMRAQDSNTIAPAEVRLSGPRSLSFIAPLAGDGGQVLAYVAVDFPEAPLRQAFESVEVPAGHLDLREGDGSGDLVLIGRGDRGVSTGDDPGIPVPGSRLRIASAPPDYWLPVTHSALAALLLALVALIAGTALFWSRSRLRARLGGPSAADEPVLAQLTAATAQPAEAKTKVPEQQARKIEPEGVIPDHSIFRAYDIRGVVGDTLTEGIARQLGRAIGSAMRDKDLSEIVIGRDGRLSGPQLAGALIEGLRAAGIDVIDIGAVPTPVSYFAAYQLHTGSCVSVTGSHNPPDYNGFKIVIGGETLAEDAIQDLYRRIVENRLATGRGSLRQYDIREEYVERIASDIQVGRSLKVVIDCGNGIPGETAPEVVRAIGCEPVPLYCDVDGTFPNHHPDPSDPKNLADLILMVKKTGADLGLAFDGDGDRLGVVTRAGEIIYPDRVLMLFAQDVLIRNPGATILYDVKCTGHLQPLILKAGGSPLMWKTGHSLIKAKMKETGAQLAGEMSGHFFFRERWYGFDDGIYSAARLLEILADDPEGRMPEQIFATLPKGVSTPELHAAMREGENRAFIARFRERARFEGARITTIDGVRADWSDGWGLVRASNTTPVLVLRFDADNADALKRIQDAFRAQLLACDSTLQLPF